MLVAAALLAIELLLTNYVDNHEHQSKEADLPDTQTRKSIATTGVFRIEDIRKAMEEEKEREQQAARPTSTSGAFSLVFGDRYLLLIGLLLLFLNWVNTTGEYILGSVVEANARAAVAAGTAGGLTVGEYIGQFYGNFFSVVNTVSMLAQLFIVSRVVKYLGVRVGIMVLPLLALGAYSFLAFFPALGVVRWMKTAENTTDYSLNNTVRNILFLPTTREKKYKAKQAIDSFFYRTDDVLSAGLVFVGTTFLSLSASGFAMVNVALVSVWLVIAVMIGRLYAALYGDDGRCSAASICRSSGRSRACGGLRF